MPAQQETTRTINHIELSPSGDVAFVFGSIANPREFSFQEGQFVLLSSNMVLDEKGMPLKRPYSIATSYNSFLFGGRIPAKSAESRDITSPHHENDVSIQPGTFGIIVKENHPGGMAEYFVKNAKIGDTLTLQGPAGHLTDDGMIETLTGAKTACKNYLLISVGSGLAPVFGIYQKLLEQKSVSSHKTEENNTTTDSNQNTTNTIRIAQLFGERYVNQILPSVIEKLAINTGNIKNEICISKDTGDETKNAPFQYNCHVQDRLDNALAFLHNDFPSIKVFLCGIPAMVEEVKRTLIEKGILEKNIQLEKY